MKKRSARPYALAVISLLLCASGAAQTATETERFTYGVEWRFVRAGEVELAHTGTRQTDMKLKSSGLVATFYKVDDTYRAVFDPGLCAVSLSLDAKEGRRHRDTKVTFDREKKRASYLEKDLNNGRTVLAKELEVPACVHEVTGALRRLRQLKPAHGATIELPVSDGKKVVMAKVEAQASEKISTPLGQFTATRYEAFLFNGVLYGRKGRLFIWVSDDERRLPVQIKVQLPFYVGTITLNLEKAQ